MIHRDSHYSPPVPDGIAKYLIFSAKKSKFWFSLFKIYFSHLTFAFLISHLLFALSKSLNGLALFDQ
jgi:hypothetical protein